MPQRPIEILSHPPLGEIERTAKEFHRLARSTSEQLKAFNEWVGRLEGNMEVYVWAPLPGGGPDEQMSLAIDRHKNSWGLFYVTATVPEEGELTFHGNFEPVESLGIAEKCNALSMVPELLRQLHSVQSDLVAKLKSVEGVLKSLPEIKILGSKEGA